MRMEHARIGKIIIAHLIIDMIKIFVTGGMHKSNRLIWLYKGQTTNRWKLRVERVEEVDASLV